MNKMDLHNIRQDYSRQSLKIDDCHDLPLEQFQRWLSAAIHAEVNEPTAMNVATVDEDGRPNARIVLLKEVTEEGIVFFTNYLSRKGRALSKHPYAALTLFWPELERQVRIEGVVKLLSVARSDAYFDSRPYSSRIGAWASLQSEVICSKAELMARVAKFSAKYLLNVPRPPYWGGYVVVPERMEFWQGRPSRLHDRIEYRLEDSVWYKKRLSP